MKFVFAASFLLATFYVLWWGYKNLLRRERDKENGPVDGGICHLCKLPYPKEELVVREKMAGFENYFCGNCIRELAADYEAKIRDRNNASERTEISSLREISEIQSN